MPGSPTKMLPRRSIYRSLTCKVMLCFFMLTLVLSVVAMTEDQQNMLQMQNPPSSHWAMDFLGSEWERRHGHDSGGVGETLRDEKMEQANKNDIYPPLTRSLPAGHPYFLVREDLDKYFEPPDVTALLSMVQAFADYPEESVWSHVDSVSISQPFIFFHQRKAGGSSLRSSLYHAASKLELSYYIPCFNKVDCDTYHFDHKKPYALYAGHFHWGEQSVFNRFSQNQASRDHFSCVTNYRHPIDRIESCLYFRFNRILEGRCLGQLSLHELHELLHHVDSYGATCLSEPFRVMGGISDEAMLDHLASVQRILPDDPNTAKTRSLRGSKVSNHGRRRLEMTAVDVLLVNTTLQNSLRCSPLVLELPQSFDEVAKRIPFLGHMKAFSADVKENVNTIHHHCSSSSLTEEQRRLIREHALLELVVYEAVYKKTYQRLLRSPNFWLTQTCWYNAHQYWYKSFYSSSTSENTTQSSTSPALLVVRYDDQGLALRSMIESALGHFIGSLHKSNVQKNDYCLRPEEEEHIITMDPIRFGFQVDSTRDNQPRFATHINLETTSNCLSPLDQGAQNTQEKGRGKQLTLEGAASVSMIIRDPFVAMWKHLFRSVDQTSTLSEKEFAEKLAVMLEERRQAIPQVQQQGSSGNDQHPGRALLVSLSSIADNLKLPNGGILSRRHHGGSLPRVTDIGTSKDGSSNTNQLEGHDPRPATETPTQQVQQIVPKIPQQPRNQPPRVVHFNRKPASEVGGSTQSQLLLSLRSSQNQNHTKTLSLSGNTVIQKITAKKSSTPTTHTTQRIFGKKKLHYVPPSAIAGLDILYKATVAEMLFDFDTFRALFNEGVHIPNPEVLQTNGMISGGNRGQLRDLIQIQYPVGKYRFYSHEAVSASAFQMLEELLLPKTKSDANQATDPTESNQPNSFTKLLNELLKGKELDISRVSCAFSFVSTMDREFIVQDLPAMRAFYSSHPLVLEAVRKVVRESLNLLRLQPDQMNFLYSV